MRHMEVLAWQKKGYYGLRWSHPKEGQAASAEGKKETSREQQSCEIQVPWPHGV